MSTSTVQPLEKADLPEEDGVPLESDWHRLAMNLLIELVILHNQGRKDYFVGGNMFVYYSKEQARDEEFRGPDFFYVAGVPFKASRPCWVVWEEGGKYPDVIIELSSPTTAAQDHGVKKDIYEQTFRTHEYFIYDPAEQLLQGWRLDRNFRYRPIQPNEQGWLWCEMLGLWLGAWTGKYLGRENVYLRFFDKDGNLVESLEEGKEAEKKRADFEKKLKEAEKKRANLEKRQKEAEKKRADDEKKRADAEKKRADAERQRADAEKQQKEAAEQRARAAEAELELLKKHMNKPEDQ